MDDWVSVAERVAANQLAPILFAGALLWMVWKAGKWIGRTVVEPAAKSHINLLDSVRDVNEKNSETQAKQASTMEHIAAGQQTQTELLGSMAEAQKVQTELLRDLAQKRESPGV